MTRFEYRYNEGWVEGGTVSDRAEAKTIADGTGIPVREIDNNGVVIWEFHPGFYVMSPYESHKAVRATVRLGPPLEFCGSVFNLDDA